MNCGPEPISNAIPISYQDLEQNEETKELSLQLIFARGVKADLDNEKEKATSVAAEDPSLQRNKERSIGFIIEKVTEWRKLYNGFYDENQELKRKSLE